MKIGPISTSFPVRMPDLYTRPPIQPVEPSGWYISDKDMLFKLEEDFQNAEFQAALWCAFMKHERRLLEIIIGGMSRV
jgi:hypothetical protein